MVWYGAEFHEKGSKVGKRLAKWQEAFFLAQDGPRF